MSPGWQRSTSRESPSSMLRKPRGGRSFVLENGTAIASQVDVIEDNAVDTDGWFIIEYKYWQWSVSASKYSNWFKRPKHALNIDSE